VHLVALADLFFPHHEGEGRGECAHIDEVIMERKPFTKDQFCSPSTGVKSCTFHHKLSKGDRPEEEKCRLNSG